MSRALSAAAISSFDAQIKAAYEGVGLLRSTVKLKTNVIGSTHRFQLAGRGVATPRMTQTDVTPMNRSTTTATATLTDWNAPEYTDIFDQAKVPFDEQQSLAITIAAAIGRREDQLILDAIDAASTTLTTSTDVGGTGTNLNTAKFRDAKKLLDTQGVPLKDRFFLAHAANIFGLLGDTTATSADFNTIRALVDGQIDTWLGFKVIQFEDRDEGGIPKPSTRTCYAYHGKMMGAIGLGIGVDFRTEVNYIPEKTSWLANGLFSGGSVAIDGAGIVEISCTET